MTKLSPAALVASRTRRVLLRALIVPAVALGTLAAADAAYGQAPPSCTTAQVAVQTAREHVPFAPEGVLEDAPPLLALVAARHAADVPLTTTAKANGLAVLGALPATRSGVLCLTVPKVDLTARTGPAASRSDTRTAPKVGTGGSAARSGDRSTFPAVLGTEDRLTPAQIAGVAYAAGFRGTALVRAVAVALAESRGAVKARCYNSGHGCDAPPATARSVDRGVWQINDRAHPDVTTACADHPACCARAAYRISNGGRSWSPWSSWKSGSARRFLGTAANVTA